MFNRLRREGKDIRSGLFAVIIFAGYLKAVLICVFWGEVKSWFQRRLVMDKRKTYLKTLEDMHLWHVDCIGLGHLGTKICQSE